MTVHTAKPISWLAEKDGTAHAHTRGATRVACGVPALDPRFSWPTQRLCEACMTAIKQEAAKAAR